MKINCICIAELHNNTFFNAIMVMFEINIKIKIGLNIFEYLYLP